VEDPELSAVIYDEVEFPDARLQVAAVLASLADAMHQQRVWVAGTPERQDAVDNLTLVVHVLYDDIRVLDDPEAAVGEVLRDDAEARAMHALADLLDPLIDELGDAHDSDYLASVRWPAVVEAARTALRSMT
jgi:hypothetical protein